LGWGMSVKMSSVRFGYVNVVYLDVVFGKTEQL
jgi:hypothetical protein